MDAFAVGRFRTLARRGELGRDPGAVDAATAYAFAQLAKRVGPDAVAGLEQPVLTVFGLLADANLAKGGELPAVERAIVDNFHRLYYHRLEQTWKQTYWRGVHVWKNPLDLWLYQEILHDVAPEVIVEAGTKFGGSAYFLANMCDLMGRGQIVTIDVTEQPNRPQHDRITYLTGSSTDTAVIEKVDRIIDGKRIVVLLDSDHSARHVLAELRAWHDRVPVGSYVIVEDTNVHGHPVFPNHGPGPMEAVDSFLAENDQFIIDESMHKFFMTFNPRGFLKRIA
ncbi:MAG TPA: CmcI family methyltransferase [Jatrophihabitans sp.]|uniref:CmcI family methyltransferase n=1 Tax=Jatrophihabitans sp. TaxID=1932789 RepID=UPI002EEFE87D